MWTLLLLATLGGCKHPVEAVDDTRDTAAEQPLPEGVADVSEALEALRAEHDLPALGGARLEAGALTHLGVTGLRAVDQQVEVRWDDQWHLGSCTKAMTATLVARLVERGVLSWTDPLRALLPEISMQAEYQQVTPIELLSHQAGLPTDIPADIWDPLWVAGDVQAQRQWFAGEILARAPAQPVGTYAYANAGYMVMGAALELETGKSWEQLMQEEVFDPLGMSSCGFGNAASGSVADQPWPHSFTNGEAVPVPPGPGDDNPPALGPAGTVHCSLADWGRFASAHVAGARADSSYLPEAQWTTLHTPVADTYALGWIVVERSWGGGTVYTHTGSNTMNFADIWLAPEIDRSFLVVTNRGEAFEAADAAVAMLIGL